MSNSGWQILWALPDSNIPSLILLVFLSFLITSSHSSSSGDSIQKQSLTGTKSPAAWRTIPFLSDGLACTLISSLPCSTPKTRAGIPSSPRWFIPSAPLPHVGGWQAPTLPRPSIPSGSPLKIYHPELPALLVRWQERLTIVGQAADIAGLEQRVAAARAQYEQLAQQLSGQRAKAAAALGRDVSQVMQQLALGGGRFEVGLLPVEGGNAAGMEQIEFRIAGLAGSEPRSLAKVASGGELSRISLAIQVVASQAARVPTLIFDEVDVGIGGGVAEVVGRLLRELGAERQVLCVTHLPQVAARANWQWQVSKVAVADQLRSHVATLAGEARVEEIARMLGGVEITAITRQHAREMLKLS
jgi:hypothetical protein